MFRWIGVVLFLIAVVFGGYYRRKSETEGSPVTFEEEGIWIMVPLRLFGFGMWLTLIAYLIHPPLVGWGQLHLPDWLRWLGVVLVVAAIPLLVWMFRTIGKNITQTVAIREGHQLITSGPYRYIRHPLYTFGGMLIVGFILLSANWFLALCAAIAWTFLLLRLPKEEAKLIQAFGDEYRQYMSTTGAFLPRL
jgi:protein-S-isoprenylcysteine O-methyltransferase Ste14